MPNEDSQTAGGQGAPVEIEQIHSVETQQIGLYRVAVLVEQTQEAD